MSTNGSTPLLEVRNVSKYFGNVVALKDVSVQVGAHEVTCVLGDNGAGKSTFIKILSGVHRHDEGQYLLDGEETHFHSPREAKERGIATVFQDLATVPLMSIWRNFFLGSEPTRGRGPLRRVDVKSAQDTMVGELKKMGIDVRDPDQPVGTLSGGERQAVAIARAVYFGAKVLILDELDVQHVRRGDDHDVHGGVVDHRAPVGCAAGEAERADGVVDARGQGVAADHELGVELALGEQRRDAQHRAAVRLAQPAEADHADADAPARTTGERRRAGGLGCRRAHPATGSSSTRSSSWVRASSSAPPDIILMSSSRLISPFFQVPISRPRLSTTKRSPTG